MSLVFYIPMANNATDKSGNGRNGTVTGATFVDNSGIRKGSYLFADSADRIVTPVITYGSKNYVTYSFWLKGNQPARENTIFNDRATTGTIGNIRISRESSSTHIIVRYATGTVTAFVRFQYVFLNFNAKWIHVVITVDVPNLTLQCYRNGVLLSTQYPTAMIPVANGSVNTIGCYTTTASSQFDGSICEVKVDEAIWTPQQVKNEYMLMKGILHN